MDDYKIIVEQDCSTVMPPLRGFYLELGGVAERA